MHIIFRSGLHFLLHVFIPGWYIKAHNNINLFCTSLSHHAKLKHLIFNWSLLSDIKSAVIFHKGSSSYLYTPTQKNQSPDYRLVLQSQSDFCGDRSQCARWQLISSLWLRCSGCLLSSLDWCCGLWSISVWLSVCHAALS